MPTILSHPAAALAFWPTFRNKNLSTSIFVAGMIASILPDIDVIGFSFGIHYSDTFGHRGFTHSIFFALLISFFLALTLRIPRRAYLFLFLCSVSHGILDAFTNGGLGIAFFSPFSNARYFFPWRPIEVSPIGLSSFISGPVFTVMKSELEFVWIPCVMIYLCSTLLVRHEG